jgi:hypothetical protein
MIELSKSGLKPHFSRCLVLSCIRWIQCQPILQKQKSSCRGIKSICNLNNLWRQTSQSKIATVSRNYETRILKSKHMCGTISSNVRLAPLINGPDGRKRWNAKIFDQLDAGQVYFTPTRMLIFFLTDNRKVLVIGGSWVLKTREGMNAGILNVNNVVKITTSAWNLELYRCRRHVLYIEK